MLTESNVRGMTYLKLVEADAKYGLVPRVEIKFIERGCAGLAARDADNKYSVTYSREAIRKFPRGFCDIVTHEVAHIVCMVHYDNAAHDEQWKNVCLSLGGDGQVTVDFGNTLTPKRIHTYFKYVLDSGEEVWFASNKHKKIQAGEEWSLRKDRQPIKEKHFTGISAPRTDIGLIDNTGN